MRALSLSSIGITQDNGDVMANIGHTIKGQMQEAPGALLTCDYTRYGLRRQGCECPVNKGEKSICPPCLLKE